MKRFATTGIIMLLVCLFCADQPAWAQQSDPIVLTSPNRPLASLRDAAEYIRNNPPLDLLNEIPNFYFKEDDRTAAEGNIGRDPLLQPFSPSVPTTILTQFDGSDNTDNGFNVTPPDTDGDVSSDAVDRYVQMINLVTTVFDKSGAVVPGGAAFFSSAFWLGFGGLCETNDNGDPIVLYDETSDRWLVSQFAFTSTSVPPWFQCVAVSTSSDPLGGYNRYAFDFSSIGFPDYPKHGFVTDDVTLMANLFAPGFSGTFIGAIDKAAMYAGTTATLVGTNLGTAEFGFVAGDLDDPAGSAGTVPALFATAMTASGLFDVWEVDPNYVAGTGTFTRLSRIPIATFDSSICPAFRGRCIPHPGVGDDLESLAGRLMHRLQIRDHGTHLSMVTAHTIDADAAPGGVPGRAGIRWYEVRSTNGGASWTLHQEGTHAPTDGLHRWMPSIAMNAAGEIGIGFMVSDDTTPVEIRVAGQTAGGPLGTFDSDEAECRAGVAGADWSGRSGDYSATNVDPDSDTFWHTNEFGRSTAFRGWGTAVCEFDVAGSGPAFDIFIKRLLRTPSGLKKAVVKWQSSTVSGNKIDFYVDETPDGSPLYRTRNDNKFKVKLPDPPFSGDGPFAIQACEKKSTTVCSDIEMADFSGVSITYSEPDENGPDDPEYPTDDREVELSTETIALSNYPNPFNPSTIISYELPDAQNVTLKVFNLLGQEVQTLVSGYQEAGTHNAVFNADQLSAGVYFYVLQAGTITQTRRMTLIK